MLFAVSAIGGKVMPFLRGRSCRVTVVPGHLPLLFPIAAFAVLLSAWHVDLVLDKRNEQPVLRG